MFYYRSCFVCSEISKKRAVSVAPKSHSAVINLCWFSVAFIGYWQCEFLLRTRKNPLLTVNIVRHSSSASWTFFPTSASNFIGVLEQTHLFSFDERKIRREQAEQTIIVGSLQAIYMRLWVWVWVIVRTSGWNIKMILWSRTHFNYDSNH